MKKSNTMIIDTNLKEYYFYLPHDKRFYKWWELYTLLEGYLNHQWIQIDEDQTITENYDYITITCPENFDEKTFKEKIQNDIVKNNLFKTIDWIKNISVEKRERIQEYIDQKIQDMLEILLNIQDESDKNIIREAITDLEKEIFQLKDMVK